jgi:hypothetical protein
MPVFEMKPEPRVGMKVIWIDPSEYRWRADFIRNRLIRKYGKCEFVISSIQETESRDWLVTLKRGGRPLKPLRQKVASKQKKRAKPEAQFSWHFLKPSQGTQKNK